jgi:hypothetical protein
MTLPIFIDRSALATGPTYYRRASVRGLWSFNFCVEFFDCFWEVV